jgi:hypothetical protein
MHLTDLAREKLSLWLGGEWHTRHDVDMRQWYDFVDQYQKDHGYSIDEHELRDEIARLAGCEQNDSLRSIISDRISLAYNILDFLKQTSR